MGPIDPSIRANYDLMKTLFGEIKKTFKDDFIHLGGDEVPFGCWQSNPNITAWMNQQNLTSYADVESVWVNGMIDIVENLKYNYVVWEEVFRQVLSYQFNQLQKLIFQTKPAIIR